jgi:outer membrane receptor protein involved in Fe transport
LSIERQRGIDFDLDYQFQGLGGDMGFGMSGTRMLKFQQQVTSTAPIADRLGTLNFPVKLKLRGRATWIGGAWSGALFVNYTDSYINKSVVPVANVKSWTTVDLNARYAPQWGGWLKGTSVSLNVQNVFDRDPPYALITFVRTQGETAIGYDPQQANPLGRFVSLRFTKTW